LRSFAVHPTPSTDRLRILHAVFSSRLAGSERYCVDLANHQAALGHEVHVVGTPGSALAHTLAPEIHFHPLGRLFRGWRLRRLASRLEVDVCHGHLSAACKAFGRLAGAPARVATLHVGYKPHQHGGLDGVICVNRAQASRLGQYRGMARTIPNWVPQMPKLAPFAGIRAELGLDENTFVIGSVGRLHESKGPDVLIAAFRAAAPDRAALVLLGDGPQRAELERLAAGDPRIHLLGHRPDVHASLRDCDLFVSPSREESFGLAIIEAMSLGLPVIATAAEGPAEYLQDQPVTLVPTGDISAMAAAIAEAGVQFQAGRLDRVAYDLRGFDPATRVGHVLDFYRQLIAARTIGRAGQSWRPSPLTT
jgi:glycosyltransferase involved in cell wall biosynthesis